jgi:hypothetical protein
MIPISTEIKFFPSPGQNRSPINEMSEIIKHMPENNIYQAAQIMGVCPSNMKITKKTIRPEWDIQNKNFLRGITVEIMFTAVQHKEVLRVHIYFSNKIEFPNTAYPAIYVHLIGHENAPTVALGVSEFLRTINI